ncbi:MAG: ABC transporter permease subunit [Candidatus Protistobacter heckmanni]|nr:ABC transporter permease subunit [Candidatus Protistobacter heckmanni]
MISTATGLASVPPELIELSRSLRASRSREYWQIRMPFAIPYIFSALKVAVAFSALVILVSCSLALYGLILWLHKKLFPWSLQ